VFPIAYLWLIAHQSLVFARYAMPIAPALSVALAVGILAAAGWWRARWPHGGLRRFALPLLLLVLVPPLWTAIGFNLDRRKVSTIEQAAAWLDGNIPAGQLVVLETASMRLPPTRFPSEISLKLVDAPLDRYRERGVAYLVANSMEYDKYYANPAGRSDRRTVGPSDRRTVGPSDPHRGPWTVDERRLRR
jgi:hypothetical protein